MVPIDFLDEALQAKDARDAGKLGLLAEEVQGLPWETEGRQFVESWQSTLTPPKPAIAYTLLFTGHRVDAPSRKEPRFPPTRKAEARARKMIMSSVLKEKNAAGEKRIIGYAGGASGGDILFHEICDEIGIETVLLLACARDAFVEKSVQDSGGDWVKRFDKLFETRRSIGALRFLGEKLELPSWLEKPDYDVWQRNNRWIIQWGIASGAPNVVLIALWDGKTGDGPGGTKDMVETIEKRGGHVDRLDANKLLVP